MFWLFSRRWAEGERRVAESKAMKPDRWDEHGNYISPHIQAQRLKAKEQEACNRILASGGFDNSKVFFDGLLVGYAISWYIPFNPEKYTRTMFNMFVPETLVDIDYDKIAPSGLLLIGEYVANYTKPFFLSRCETSLLLVQADFIKEE